MKIYIIILIDTEKVHDQIQYLFMIKKLSLTDDRTVYVQNSKQSIDKFLVIINRFSKKLDTMSTTFKSITFLHTYTSDTQIENNFLNAIYSNIKRHQISRNKSKESAEILSK